MSNFRNSHWIITEESRYSINFDGSLQPKMSLINIVNDIFGLLKCLIRWFSAVQSDLAMVWVQ